MATLLLMSVPTIGGITLEHILDDPVPQSGAAFGGVAAVGDINGDSVPDVAVTAAQQDVGGNVDQGRVYIFSGADGTLLYTLDHPSPQANVYFGSPYGVISIGDLNGDSVSEIAAGAPWQTVAGSWRQGQYYVFSGADGALLYTLSHPNPQADAHFGYSAAVMGDVDGDGTLDMAVSAHTQTIGGTTRQGQVYVVSGIDGSLLYTVDHPSPRAHSGFGKTLGALGDVDGDSMPDLAVGADIQTVGSAWRQGQAYVFSGADGSYLYTLDDPAPQADARFGWDPSGVGDVDGDGVPDIAVAARYQDVGGNTNQGQVSVFSGADGSLLHTLDDPSPSANHYAGASIEDLGVLDGDAVPDIAVGIANSNGNQGHVWIFSGADGSPLLKLDHPNPMAHASFGVWIAELGTVDGTTLFAVGAWVQDVGGNANQGQAYVFSVRLDSDGDGISDPLDGDFLGGVFVDMSTDPNNDSFTDQHLGGTSFGLIVNRGGLTLTVLEAPNPEGLRVQASGGTGSAKVKGCGTGKPIKLTSGDDIVVTCSALTMRVIEGPVEIELSEDNFVSVPDGGTVTVTELGDEQVQVTNDSTGVTILIVMGGEVTELEPGASDIVCSELPTVTPPGPITLECNSQGGVLVSDAQIQSWLTSAAGFSVCGGVTLGDDAPAMFPVGVTAVTFTALDDFGVVTSDTSTVTVEDTTPPSVSVELTPDTLWPPNHRMIDVAASVTAMDVCSTPGVVLTSLISNEADNGEGDGNTVDDIQDAEVGTPDLSFKLRAERAGGGSGRIYTATYTATDTEGNPGNASGYAVVPHDQGGITEPITLSLQENGNGTVVSWTEAPGALSYDVIRGQLSRIVETGVVIDLGAVVCIEDDSPDASTRGWEDAALPNPGEPFFYLVEYYDGTHSSYGTESAAKQRVPGAGACQ